MSDERWTDDLHRADGIKIVRHPEDAGAWIVVAPGGSIDECPCCGKVMLSPRAARLVADIVYPMAA
jgi:hypothetical protein